jgi:energy-converting hydrogenase A subunit R
MNTYIVSTSYGQYIEAVSNYMDLPFENTFYTKVNLDNLTLTDEEMEKITEFKKMILENPDDYELFDDIFFSQISKMTAVFLSLNTSHEHGMTYQLSLQGREKTYN